MKFKDIEKGQIWKICEKGMTYRGQEADHWNDRHFVWMGHMGDPWPPDMEVKLVDNPVSHLGADELQLHVERQRIEDSVREKYGV